VSEHPVEGASPDKRSLKGKCDAFQATDRLCFTRPGDDMSQFNYTKMTIYITVLSLSSPALGAGIGGVVTDASLD
jgi:hypothetical protein